jgi:N-acetylmuramoyl-L-alanine amidase
MIKNGIIQDSHIKGTKVSIDLVPVSNKFARPAKPMTPSSITVHETGNANKGADAKAHAAYIKTVKTSVSWHFTVDDNEIYQHLPINENAWHAGDGGKGKGNTTSIAVEICINEDGDFQKAKENAKRLVQYLMNETGVKEVVPHKHWSGKECPRNILASGWDKFHSWLLEEDRANEVEQLKAERNFWKQRVYDMLNVAEKATIEGAKLYTK